MVLLERKIAIIGAAGMLGYALRNVFPESILLDVNDKESAVQKVDIAQIESLESALEGFGTNDWVINAAAYTKVNDAETSEGKIKSYRTNEIGPKNLALVSLSEGFQILHFSTAYVFDGRKGMYEEKDETNPINTYGKHKLAGEKPILNGGGIVLRTDTLYGPHGDENFIDTMRGLVQQRKSIPVVNDQIVSPTYTADLAQMTKAVIDYGIPINGVIYHAVNDGRVSRADLVREIIKILGLKCDVIDVSTHDYNQNQPLPTAERPPDCSLATNNLLSALYKPRTWQIALREYLTVSR